MANAYCHMIKVAVERGIQLNEDFYKMHFIAQHKRFTPNMQMFHVKGIIPDVKIGKYKSLFILPEWECIVDSTLDRAEKALAEVMKTSLDYSTVLSTLRKIERIRKDVELDALSIEVKKIRRERLLIASQLKAKHKLKSSFKLSAAVWASYSDTRVAEAFNPFRIPFANDVLETSPGECSALIEQSEEGIYRYVPTEQSDKLDDGAVKRIAITFTAWMNS